MSRMTSPSNLSDQVGIPSGRFLVDPGLLMYTRLTGAQWYRSHRTASMIASIFRSDMPSTVSPVTPGVSHPRFDRCGRRQPGTVPGCRVVGRYGPAGVLFCPAHE